MAGELLVINPRRRRRRSRKARSTHRRKSHRRRRHAFAVSNPRRRRRRTGRRSVARRTRRRRHHRNPSLGGGLMSGLKTGVGFGIGVVVTEIGASAAIKYLPGIPAGFQSGLGKTALKAVVGGIVIPAGLKLVFRGRSGMLGGLARNVAIGAWISVAVDLLHEYVTPHLGLGEYQMGEYITSGVGDTLAPEEIGAAENMYGDTMY